MNTVDENVNTGALGARWWVLVVRGVAAVLFGVVALAWPSISLLALVLLWGAYALVDGASSVALAARAGPEGPRWGWVLFAGLVSIAAGILTAMWPGISTLALLMVIAGWAVLTGVAAIVAAIQLRRVIRGEWMLAVCGVLSIAFGVLTMILPGPSALALVTILGIYALVFGVLVTALGFRVRRWATREKRALVGGVPAHAWRCG